MAKCQECGAELGDRNLFCEECGARVSSRPVHAQKADVKQGAPRRSRRLVITMSCAAGLALLLGSFGIGGGLYLTRGTTNLRLLPAILSSIIHNGWSGRLNPEPIKKTGTAPIDIRPLAGVRITAPANALDKPRTLQVTPVDSTKGKQIASAAFARKEIPVAAFRLDAGMRPDDLFPGEITISLDLAQRKIPKGLWPFARIYHVDERGQAYPMVVSFKGSTVSCRARHNYIFAVFLGVGYASSIIVYLGASEKFAGEDQWLSFSSKDFKAYWSSRLPPRNPAVFNPVNDELEALWKKYLSDATDRTRLSYLDEPGSSNPMLEAYVRYRADARVRELLPKMSDDAWLLQNFVPVEVGNGLKVLERCYGYLTGKESGQRGFREPAFKIDVLFRENWPHGDEVLGLTTTGNSLYPYIDLRRKSIPSAPLADDGAGGPVIDELYCTAVHELFHALQRGYSTLEVMGHQWFMEATAVELEGEAFPYFVGKGWVATPRGTDRQSYFTAYFDPLAIVTADSGPESVLRARRHGYGASFYLEYLRDRYYRGGASPEFLPKLMADFGSWSGDTLESLVHVTSGSDEQFGQDFSNFCHARARELMAAFEEEYSGKRAGESTVRLTWAAPVCTWTMDTPRPVSCRFLRVLLESPARGARQDDPGLPVLGVAGNDFTADGVILRLSPEGVRWQRVTGNAASVKVPKDRKGECQGWLQRIETYVDPPGKFKRTAAQPIYPTPGTSYDQLTRPAATVTNKLFALLSGPAPVKTKQSGDRVGIAWSPSPLAQEGLLKDYEVQVQVAGHRPFEDYANAPQYDIDLKKIYGKDRPKPGETAAIVYRLRSSKGPEAVGPWSQPLQVEMAEDLFEGTWKGTVTITGEKVGDAIRGTLTKIFGEGAKDAVRSTNAVGSSNSFSLAVTPHAGRGADYDVVWSNENRPNWAGWQTKGEGRVDGDALVVELKHPDGSVLTLKLVSEGKDRLKGGFAIGAWLMKDAVSGTAAASRSGTPAKR